MDESLHDIDKLFLDNIEGHTEYPPKKLWDNIDAGLDKTNADVYKRKYEKTKRVALILLFFIAGILLYEAVTLNHNKNKAAPNLSPGSTGDNKELQGNADETTTTQPKTKTVIELPEVDSSHIMNENNRDNRTDKDKEDIETGLKDKDNFILPGNNKPATVDQKKIAFDKTTIKDNKINQDTEPSNLVAVQSGGGSAKMKKNKKVPENKSIPLSQDADTRLVNTSGDNKIKNKVAANQATATVSPLLQSKDQLPALQNKRNRAEETVAITPAITMANPVNTFNINDIINLPVIDPGIQPTRKNIKINPGKQGFYLSAFFSPNATWNNLENDKPHQGGGGNHADDHNAIEKDEHHDLSYTAGLKLGYSFNKKIAIQTGLNYTAVSTRIGPKLIFADRDNNGNVRYRLDCSSGYSYLLPANGQPPSSGDSLVVNDSRNSLAYAGIPLTLEYKLVAGNKISLSATVGGQANILVKSKTTTVFGKGTANQTTASGNTEALKSSYFSAITGITGELRLNKKLSLTVTPAALFGLTSINNGASVKTKANYFSVAAGLKLKL